MYVERIVWEVQPDKQDEFVEFLHRHMSAKDNPVKRIYTPRIGVLNQVVAELEYKGIADWEMAWHEWKSPEKAAEVGREQELAKMIETTVWGLVE